MENNELIQGLNTQLHLGLPELISEEALEQKLTEFVEHLIDTDFERLVQILYKTDVSENELKKMLETESGKNSSSIIARLIIKKEFQKIESRKKYSSPNDADGSERW